MGEQVGAAESQNDGGACQDQGRSSCRNCGGGWQSADQANVEPAFAQETPGKRQTGKSPLGNQDRSTGRRRGLVTHGLHSAAWRCDLADFHPSSRTGTGRSSSGPGSVTQGVQPQDGAGWG